MVSLWHLPNMEYGICNRMRAYICVPISVIKGASSGPPCCFWCGSISLTDTWQYDVVINSWWLLPPVIHDMTYHNVFTFPYECTRSTISLPVRFLSPQLLLLGKTVMLHSQFPLTSGTHSIYVDTIDLLVAWRQVFVLIWRPPGLLNRVRQFWFILSLVCIQADH